MVSKTKNVPHKVCRKCGNTMRVQENVSRQNNNSLMWTASCATCGAWFDCGDGSDALPTLDFDTLIDTEGEDL